MPISKIFYLYRAGQSNLWRKTRESIEIHLPPSRSHWTNRSHSVISNTPWIHNFNGV